MVQQQDGTAINPLEKGEYLINDFVEDLVNIQGLGKDVGHPDEQFQASNIVSRAVLYGQNLRLIKKADLGFAVLDGCQGFACGFVFKGNNGIPQDQTAALMDLNFLPPLDLLSVDKDALETACVRDIPFVALFQQRGMMAGYPYFSNTYIAVSLIIFT